LDQALTTTVPNHVNKVVVARLLAALTSNQSYFYAELIGDPDVIEAKDIWSWICDCFENKDLTEVEVSQLNKKFEELKWSKPSIGAVDAMHKFFRCYHGIISKIVLLMKIVPDYHEKDKVSFDNATQGFLKLCQADERLKHVVTVCEDKRREKRATAIASNKATTDYGAYDLKGCYIKMCAALAVDNKAGFANEPIANSGDKKEKGKDYVPSRKETLKGMKHHNLTATSPAQKDKDPAKDQGGEGENANGEKTNKSKRKVNWNHKKNKSKDAKHRRICTGKIIDDPHSVPDAATLFGLTEGRGDKK
jgi:hypothetical protein